jgi:hypothetical protein
MFELTNANLVICVPAVSIPDYAAASGWSVYASRLIPLEDHEDGGYVPIADAEVLRVLVEKGVDKNGTGYLSGNECAAVTSISTWFSNNKVIKTFDELEKFGITAVTGNSSSTAGAFKNSSIESLRLPNTVTSIQPYAFFGCTALVSLGKLPSSITSIGQSAFQGCSVLSDIELSHALTSFGVAAFYKASALAIDVDEPNLTSIGNYAFAQSGITSITNLGKITALPDGASAGDRPGVFTNCKSLVSAVLPNTLTTIGAFAFYGNTALESIDVDWSKITKINGNAFYNCTSLAFDELNLPNLTTLGSNAFYGVKIKKLSISALNPLPTTSNTSIANYGDKATLEEVVLSNALTAIPAHSFANYVNLSKISLNAEAITSIGNMAFMSTNLGAEYVVNFPNLADETLGDRAWFNSKVERFENLGKIQKLNKTSSGSSFGKDVKFVRLPSTFTTFQGYGFYECSKLETLIIEAVTPPALTTTDFAKASNTFVVYVPDESVEAYKTATNWSSFASRIYPMSDLEWEQMGNVLTFEDATVEAIALDNWDTDGDGVLSKDEVKAVTSVGTIFRGNTTIVSFDEFKYFTGVTSIASNAFRDCSTLKSIDMSNLTSIAGDSFRGCTALTAMNAKNLTSLGAYAFQGCSSLKAIDLGAVTSIGNNTFANCVALENLELKNVTTLNTYTFMGCSVLAKVDASNLTSIGIYAFAACPALKAFICRTEVPPTLSSTNAFQNTTNCIFYVPDEAVDAYKEATNWSSFASRIKPLSEYTE